MLLLSPQTIWSLERLAAGLCKKMTIREEDFGAGKDILTHVSENVIQWHKNRDYIWCCLYLYFLFLHGYTKYCSKRANPGLRSGSAVRSSHYIIFIASHNSLMVSIRLSSN